MPDRRRMNLAEVAPRIAQARDQLVAIRVGERNQRKRLRDEVMRLERLHAHRDLQRVRCGALTRAPASARASYTHERQRKLEQSETLLARAERELREAEERACFV